MGQHQAPETYITQRLKSIPNAEIELLISFTLEAEDRVRSRQHLPIRGARQVHPKKREAWIGQGVDQSTHQSLRPWPEPEILAAEWHDAQFGIDARPAGQTVAEQAR